MDPSKILAMTQWPVPRNIKALRGFLGLIGYYRKFICRYAYIAAPLTDLLKKESFKWFVQAQDAFEAFKLAVTSTPVLALPNFDLPFELETDASGVGIGVVLAQMGHPIAYFSQKLSPAMQRASTYAREMFVITEAVLKWR